MTHLSDKVEKLVSLCKGSVSIRFNDNTTNYETVEECIRTDFSGLYKGLDDDVAAEMFRRNRMVEVHFYPDTPVGFYHITHYDLEAAVDEALEVLEEKS